MTDIVERLRCQSPYLKGSSAELLMNEAADEIERLRAEIEWRRTAAKAWVIAKTNQELCDEIERLRSRTEKIEDMK